MAQEAASTMTGCFPRLEGVGELEDLRGRLDGVGRKVGGGSSGGQRIAPDSECRIGGPGQPASELLSTIGNVIRDGTPVVWSAA